MNTTDSEIAGMKEELSQAVYLIGKYLNETPLGNQPHMIAQPAQQWLEQRRKRSLVERANGGTSLYHDFFIAWNRCESNRGCYSCCEPHDCRCEKDRGISKTCTCGRDELEAIETKIDEQEGAI